MARFDTDDDDDSPFDRNGVLRDGRSTRISSTLRDSASDRRSMFDASLHKPGHRFASADSGVRVIIADDREVAYRSYEDAMADAWRGDSSAGTFSGAPEVGAQPVGPGSRPGDQCTVRSGGKGEGGPGRLVETSPGWLVCRPVEIGEDARRDALPVRDVEQAYTQYAADMANAWRNP